MFETVTGKHVLTDGKRSIEIHEITGSGHNDAYLLVYLPAEGVAVPVGRLHAGCGQRAAAGDGESVIR